MGRERVASTIEVRAPIATVWELLMQPSAWLGSDAQDWSVTPTSWDLWGGPLQHRLRSPRGVVVADSTTIESRCPDLLRWSLTGALEGTVTFELDDLDELTFVRSTWEIAPAGWATRARLGLGRNGLAALHDAATSALATSLGRRTDCARVRVRSAGDRRRSMEFELRPQLRTA